MRFLHSRNLLLCLTTCMLLWGAFPGTMELWPLALIGLVPILFMATGENVRTSLIAGFFCGVVHHVLLLYWLVTVLGKYGGLPLYLAIPGLLLLSSYMAIYLGLFTALTSFFAKRLPDSLLLFLLPALWVGLDWWRGMFLTGVPWMDLGYVLYKAPALIQVADLLGHHGVTYLIIFINCFLFLVIKNRKASGSVLYLSLATLLFVAGGVGYSVLQFERIGGRLTEKSDNSVSVGIVQGNIDQSLKWAPVQQRKTVEKYFELTNGLLEHDKPTFIVWPETALPFYPKASEHTRLLQAYVAEKDVALLTGSPWFEIIDRQKRKVAYYNSAFLMKPDGFIDDKYYKNHLVPFGEYVPLKKFLFFLAPLVESVGDFSPGRIIKPISRNGVEAGILICFESVFPELSRKWVKVGANVLVNLTNDAWYGKSSAPYHSLSMAVFRAVETRRSVIRSANTGISAFISPQGTIENRSEIFVPWSGVAEVSLWEETTFWVRYGYLFGPFCLAFSVSCAILVKMGLSFRRGEHAEVAKKLMKKKVMKA